MQCFRLNEWGSRRLEGLWWCPLAPCKKCKGWQVSFSLSTSLTPFPRFGVPDFGPLSIVVPCGISRSTTQEFVPHISSSYRMSWKSWRCSYAARDSLDQRKL